MRLRTGALIVTLALGILSLPLASAAQTPAKVPTIGYLNPNPAAYGLRSSRTEAFRQGLRELGWVEGQNITIEYRWAEGKSDRLPDLAAELARLKVDVIFAVSSSAVRAARNVTRTVPIVALDLETDPVAAGLAASLARPGENITGMFLDLPELNGKRLELLKEAIPRLSRVAILWDSSMDRVPLKAAEVAARILNLRLHILEVRGPDDLETAFRTATRERVGALMVIQSPILERLQARIADLAAKSRLPTSGIFGSFVEAGGLMSYGPNLDGLFRRAPSLIDKILRGAKPGDVPMERPTKFELVINLKTAKALGLTLPQSILIRADQVIQ